MTFLVLTPKNGVALKFYQNNSIFKKLCYYVEDSPILLYALFVDLATNAIPYWIVFMNPSHCNGSRCLNHL